MFEVEALVFTVLEYWRGGVGQLGDGRDAFGLSIIAQETNQCFFDKLTNVGYITVDDGVHRRLAVGGLFIRSTRTQPLSDIFHERW